MQYYNALSLSQLPLPIEKVHVIGHPLVVVGQGAEKSCQVLTVTQEGREGLSPRVLGEVG